MPLNIAVPNTAAFDRLPRAQQEAVREARRAAQEFGWRAVADRVAENHAVMRQRGVTVVTELDPASMRALIAAGEPTRERRVADMGPR